MYTLPRTMTIETPLGMGIRCVEKDISGIWINALSEDLTSVYIYVVAFTITDVGMATEPTW